MEIIRHPFEAVPAGEITARLRRNLHPDHYAYYRGKLHEQEKQGRGEYQKRQIEGFGLKGSTARRIAREHGVNIRTVERRRGFRPWRGNRGESYALRAPPRARGCAPAVSPRPRHQNDCGGL